MSKRRSLCPKAHIVATTTERSIHKKCDLEPYPVTLRVFDACMQLDAFDKAQPMNQPDAE